jgi:hypothetical protein
MRSEFRRLRTIALRRGLCPIHMERLWCAVCDYDWTGTESELAELGRILDKVAPYVMESLHGYGRCGVCGEPRWCGPCYTAAVARLAIPDLYTPEERDRRDALLQRLHRKEPPGGTGHALCKAAPPPGLDPCG